MYYSGYCRLELIDPDYSWCSLGSCWKSCLGWLYESCTFSAFSFLIGSWAQRTRRECLRLHAVAYHWYVYTCTSILPGDDQRTLEWSFLEHPAVYNSVAPVARRLWFVWWPGISAGLHVLDTIFDSLFWQTGALYYQQPSSFFTFSSGQR